MSESVLFFSFNICKPLKYLTAEICISCERLFFELNVTCLFDEHQPPQTEIY